MPKRYHRKRVPFTPAEEQRFEERGMVERVYSRLKELMFGVLALTVDQLLKLTG